MAIRQDTQTFDPLSGPIPGQSFTDPPGLRPWERPPMTANPEQLMIILEESIREEQTEQKIADMLEVKVSAETIAESLMQKCFMEGLCSPDTAEIVKPAIFMIVVQIGTEHNIDDMVLFNDIPEEEAMSPDQKLIIKSKTAPDEIEELLKPEPPENFEQQEDMDFDEMPDSTGSFMDMEPSVIENPQEEI